MMMPQSATLRRALAPESRARLFIVITILLATTFGVLTWRGMRDERTRVAFRTCFYAEDAARLLQAKARLHLERIASPIFAGISKTEPFPSAVVLKRANHALASRTYFRGDVDARGAVSGLAIEPGDSSATAIDSVRLAHAIDSLASDARHAGVIVAAGVMRSVADTDVLDAIAIMKPTYGVDGRPRAWYGLLVSPTTFAKDVVKPVFDSEPLFSSMLATMTVEGITFPLQFKSNRSLANLAIMDEHWTTIYATGPMTDTVLAHFQNPGTTDNYESPGCVGISPMDPTMASLSFMVSPTLPVYNQWVANGLVASYVPSIGAVLAAMLACMAAAILFARREAELARLRSDFVSNVSHELRMSLAQILMSGETLRLGRTRSQAERDGEADSIAREAHRLTGFVDNVLSFSRIEHQNAQVAPRVVRLCPVVQETIATARALADGRQAIVASTIQADLEAFVDPDGFRQVLYNLLENAIKYGPVGQRIVVGAAPSPTAADRIDVWVDDEGPGVPASATSSILEPFVRLDRDRNTGVAGSGLGLAVVRFIIEEHGGRVRIERGKRGLGARFVVDIPRKC